MAEKHNYWPWKNLNGSLQTCNCSETKFYNNTASTKYIFLDIPEFKFQDKSEEIVENFAANLISKLFHEAFKMTCSFNWSIPCLLNCHSFNLPFWSDSIQWHDVKLYFTPELLKDGKLSILSPVLSSASKNSLTKANSKKIENSKCIKKNISHLFLSGKNISDMYNVPFDSDIYAIPLDVMKNISRSRSQTKLINSNNRYYHSSSSFFEKYKFSKESFADSNTNYTMEPYSSKEPYGMRCDIQNKYSEMTSTAPEAVHITMEEVRKYLKTLYSTSYPSIESRNLKNPVKLSKNPFKSIYNNLPNVSKQPKNFNDRKTFTFVDRKKKKKNNVCSYTTESQNLNSNDKLKNRSTYQRFPINFKQILYSIFGIKKLPFSHHNFCRDPNNVGRDKITVRLSKDKGQHYSNLKTKPSFSKRALPPLPKFQDERKNTIHKKLDSLREYKENSFFHSPPPFPPLPAPSSLTFEPRLTTKSVDFATSIEKVKNYGWYWGPISGEAAEKILTNEPDGSFIVRDSSDDYYIFSLTFKLNSIIRHVRIEHDQGNFSFGNSTRFKSHTIVDFIESAVEHSRSGRYLFFLHRRPVLGPMRVQLLHPVSRFKQVQSLQHLSRFVILKIVRKDLISSLPLPKSLLNYLSAQHYYSENLMDEQKIELPVKDNVNQFIKFTEEDFS